MRNLNLLFLSILVFIFPRFSFAQNDYPNFKNTLEDAYLLFNIQNTITPVVNSFFSNEIDNPSNLSVAFDYNFTAGLRLRNNTFGSISLSKFSLKHKYDYTENALTTAGDVINTTFDFKFKLGIDQYIALLEDNTNAFFVLSCGLFGIRTEYSYFKDWGSFYYFEYLPERKWVLGVDLSTRFEYRFYKRYSIYGYAGSASSFNAKSTYKYSLFIYDSVLDERKYALVQNFKPYHFYYGVGIKIGLESQIFYK